MLTKFDVRSCRVKGISFHKTRPWVLCGLHNGAVQIWDYRTNTSIDTYTEHNGSVRGVDFHISQPLFVSGADDYLIKVWNYKLRRCLFTLKGHMDYIRVTFFHHEQPWILSCSDDFTVRIWNWQSRSSVACLPGHNHYVMCAQFHPTEDLVVSGSLDRTIRVWDISSLRLRKQEVGLAQDLLGTSDVALKYLLEGHEKGVNWVCFHPMKPYIASAADDRTVRVWRMMDSSCHEEIQLRGHTNNVCCVTYMKDFLISNSEDRTIRVWDVKARNPIMVFRREADRYWILATLPEKNLIAAGHDSGMQVFKLFRERPAWILNGKLLHYIYENTLYSHDLESKVEYKFVLSPHLHPPRTISCNPVDNMAVVWYDTDGGVAETFTIPKPGYAVDADVRKRTNVTDAVFFSPNKYAFVDKNKKLAVCNCQGDREKVVTPEHSCKRVFPGPMGSIVCQTEEGVELYHMAQHDVTATATVSGVRHVVWDKDFNKVAFMTKNSITVMTRRLKMITTIVEPTVRMKSASFDEQRNILYYTTANHLKYCNLRTGECSTIQTMKSPAYLVRASGDTIWAITREGRVIMQELENLELNFKLKLQQQSYRDVIKIIHRKQLKGQALVGYLHKHGHSEIALHFVTEPLTRFNLAVECGALDIAKATALELNQAAVWRRLAEAATSYGDIQLGQFANSKTGNYHGAGLLSLITGNLAALGHLVDTTNDDNFKLHYGLYLQDVQQRVKILVNAGQLPLAYLTAKSNGLDELASELLERMEPEVAERMQQTKVNCVSEATRPTALTENWPMLQVEESVFARLLKEPNQFNGIEAGIEEEEEEALAGAGWDEDEGDSAAGRDAEEAEELNGVEGGGWDDDLDIEVPVERGADGAQKGMYVVPNEHPPLSRQWVDNYSLPAFHVAAGSFSTAFDLLRRQIGLCDPAPLKPYMINLWASVNASRPASLVPSVMFPLTTFPMEEQRGSQHVPQLPDYVPVLTEKLKAGYAAFVEGRFSDALEQFVAVIHQAALATYKNEKQRATLLEFMTIAPEYARALNVQLHCRNADGNSKEALELSLYFTHFKLQRAHLTLALSQAMSKAYKKKSIKTAAAVARRLLDQDPPKAKANQAAAIVAEGERNPTDAEPVEYDERNPFVLCSVSHRPMYKGTIDPIRCSYCYSPAHPDHKGKKCPVCRVAFLGAESAGLVNRA
ncbi:putative coatomer alpha subunit [Trypanosoma grayi]|uniref:putative coatomer alpha subunit n=1 Tax=Trypanosoma grayi TaxID=71804 RepID=UPI0004F40AE3|nr:putative coatomer alpha subunit [Trypanosoma grayi]KEG08003.1 putative coatomer alpha subunit [Trypanosoma grayi]